jgi:hypothetical protein
MAKTFTDTDRVYEDSIFNTIYKSVLNAKIIAIDGTVSITEGYSTSISIASTPTVQYTAVTTPTGQSVTWTSSDNSVATITNAGLATFLTAGKVTFTVKLTDNTSVTASTGEITVAA